MMILKERSQFKNKKEKKKMKQTKRMNLEK
jgi:hypothetical protein